MAEYPWDSYKRSALRNEVNDRGEVSFFVGDPQELSHAFVVGLQEEARSHGATVAVYDDAVFVVFNAAKIFVELNWPSYVRQAQAAVVAGSSEVCVAMGSRDSFSEAELRALRVRAAQHKATLSTRNGSVKLVFQVEFLSGGA